MLAFDPHVAPAVVPIETVRDRQQVALGGIVTAVAVDRWAGGVASLHATISDATGSFTLAFVGRPRVQGVGLGQELVAAGTAVRRRGRLILMNPYLWLVHRSAVRAVAA